MGYTIVYDGNGECDVMALSLTLCLQFEPEPPLNNNEKGGSSNDDSPTKENSFLTTHTTNYNCMHIAYFSNTPKEGRGGAPSYNFNAL